LTAKGGRGVPQKQRLKESGGDMKYQTSVDGKAGDHELFLGNEAAVRGVLEADWSDSPGAWHNP
jgi:hypothetical protein